MPTTPDKTQPLAVYVRVSRVGGREGERFISPDVQRAEASRYAASRGFAVSAEVFDDLDVSGGSALEDRPGMAAILRGIEAGKLGGVVVATQDRLARDLGILRDLRTRLKALSAVLLVGDNPSAEDDEAEGFAALPGDMRGLFDEALRGEARKRFRVARREAVQRGIHVSSKTPTGYLKGPDRRLIPDPFASLHVAEVFRRRAVGTSLKGLAAYLQEAGVAGPYRANLWTSAAVSKLLKNRAYRGEARSGEFLNEQAHPAIVTEAEWAAAQSPRPSTTSRGEGSLFAGLLRCAGCGYVMKADKMTDRTGERIRLYRCRGEHAAGTCHAKASVLERVIEPFVMDALFSSGQFTLGPIILVEDDGVDREALLREAELAQANLDEYLASDVAAIVGAAKFRENVIERQARLEQAQTALKVAEADLADEIECHTAGRDTVNAAKALWYGRVSDDAWIPAEHRGKPSISLAGKRQILAQYFDTIVVAQGRVPIGERTRLFWRGEAPADLPRRGKRLGLRAIDLNEGRSRGDEANVATLPVAVPGSASSVGRRFAVA